MPALRAALAALTLLAAGTTAAAQEGAPAPSAAPATDGAAAAASRRVDAGLPRRCGVCHLDKAPPGTPGFIVFTPPGGAGTAGATGMCYSCHNGIVDDQRRWLGAGRHHPASGRVSCGSCHTPHVQEANVGTFMRHPRGSYGWCSSCHPGRRSGEAGEHPAVAAEKDQPRDCGGCHLLHGARGEGLLRAASAEALCVPCHGENPSRQGKGPGMATHVTGKSGPPCLGCHSVHRTVGGRALLEKAAFEGRLCRQCHDGSYSPGKGEPNHPVSSAGATCLSCHRMHNAERQGARRGLLAVAWNEAEGICRRCHAGLAASPAGDGAWNHPLGGSVVADERSLGSRLARSGAFFAPGGKATCLSCHRSHRGQPGTPQLVTARQALCLYCHPAQNPLDPEQAALGAHPVAVRPRKARIDAAFLSAGGVTGPEGELTCGTCHRAHRGSAGTPGLVLPRESYSCLLCHSGEAAIASTSHGGARVPGAPSSAAGTGLCGGCHGEHGWRVLQDAPKDAAGGLIERICLSCHGGLAEGTVPVATNHPLGVSPASGKGTGGLPLFWTDGRKSRKGTVACATCHDPHRAGPGGDFLRERIVAGSRELCLSCHSAQMTVVGTRHDMKASRGSMCGPCHPVHEPFAVATWPTVRGGGERSAVEQADFCSSCHGVEGTAAAATVREQGHPANPRAGQQVVGCGECHDPHRWNPEDPADRGDRQRGDASTSFLVRRASDAAPLCAGCHAEQQAVIATAHDLRDGRSSAAGGAATGRDGVCSPCHRAHGGREPAAPTAGGAREAVAGAAAAAAPDPCTLCHAVGGLAAGSVVGPGGHPVGIVAPQDFGPELPLFAMDGRREPRGRIVCATCHDPHRWEAPGGSGSGSRAASSFLRIGADGYAPLCFSCHADKSMVVGTDHDLRVTAPRAVNLAGESADASGVCGACHAIHGAGGGLALWNRGFGVGWDDRSRICTGCHRPDNDQGARVPPRTETHLVSYPGRGMVNRLFTSGRAIAAGEPGIALFAADGTRAAEGHLSCASCHDVHRWESQVSSSGPGVPVEGSIENSFLRVPPAGLGRTLCAECHGGNLVDYYRTYHFPEGK